MAENGTWPTEPTGSGLARAFEVLSRTPEERLLSLTYKMGGTRAEVIVHAMCLIHLKKSKDAYVKLSDIGHIGVANFLAEMIKTHGDELNTSHIYGFNISDAETLLDIARIFAVLVRERSCDASIRDQAYAAALAASNGTVDADNIVDEMRKVCGIPVVDKSDKIGALSSLDASERNASRPSSLRTSSVCSSHTLEISSPTIPESSIVEAKPTTKYSEPTNTNTSDQSQALQRPDEWANFCATNPPRTTAEVPSESILPKPKQCVDHDASSQHTTSKSTNPSFANETDDTFYAFVILHEPEDVDEALRLRDKLEGIISGVGATFSEMEEPGRSTLRCLEDAIDNSAFTLPLLTRNFSSNLSETSTDSAIFNSLEKWNKKNTVIPLLPLKNFLPKDRFGMLLRSKVPLDENSRTFERAALKAMAPERVASQRKVWLQEQRIKKAKEEQKRLQEERIRNQELQRETERLARLRLQNNTFYAQSAYPGPPPWCGAMPSNVDPQHSAWQPPPSCIHIENAQNVMIGNHSTMNIDHDPSLEDDN